MYLCGCAVAVDFFHLCGCAAGVISVQSEVLVNESSTRVESAGAPAPDAEGASGRLAEPGAKLSG
jgi:hypothetical protein